MMGDDQQDVYKDIAEKQGLPFDRGYLREMRQDHEEDIKLFSEAAQKAGDPGVRAFAGRTLPHLREHLDRATKAEAAVRNRK
jgi:putative membrane protein